jgi:methyl-accepting chemotaxis protein
MVREREAVRDLAAYQHVTELAMQVKFRSADFNGWQTAYAFDVVRGVPGAADDATGSRKAFLESAAAFRADLTALAGQPLAAADRDRLNAVLDLFAQFMALDKQIIAAYAAGTPTGRATADDLVATDEIAIFNQIAAQADALVASVDRQAQLAQHEAQADGRRARLLLVAVTGSALVAGVLLVVGLTRSLTGPLRRLRHRLAEIADGDGDLTQRVDADRKDELGQVGQAFNRFAERIQALVAEVAGGAGTVAGSAEELGAVSRQVAGGAEETSAQAAAVRAAADEVSRNVHVVAAGSEELGTSIRDIASSAAEAAGVAIRAGRLAEQANQTVSQLGASCAEIGNVVKLITAVAGQTNLLALNATIEAARAGAYGSGFAVVAREVKDLASTTTGAAEDIAARIAALQADSAAAGTAITQIADVIAQITQYSSTIAAAVEEQPATTGEMSRNITEAAASAGQIAANVSGLAEAAQQSSAGASGTRETADDLARAAARLEMLVKAFRYEDRAGG